MHRTISELPKMLSGGANPFLSTMSKNEKVTIFFILGMICTRILSYI